MIYNFNVLDTREGSSCVFSIKKGESVEEYKKRLKREWETSPLFRQHCFIYGKLLSQGRLNVAGEQAEIAISLIRVILKKFMTKGEVNA